MSDTPIAGDYIKAESMAGRMDARLMAIVAEGDHGRVYLAPTPEHEEVARRAEPKWKPDQAMNRDTRDLVSGRGYGFFTWADLFTPRQLVALTTFSDLVAEVMTRIQRDILGARASRPKAGGTPSFPENETPARPGDETPLRDGGTGATAYAEAVAVYLAMALNRMGNTLCTIARWTPIREQTVTAFARQAIPMTWDFPDVNPFAGAAGDYSVAVDGVIKGMTRTIEPDGFADQQDATSQFTSVDKIVSTDPPYYDNISYADLSDFFYVWLRRSLRPTFPDLFATLVVPKAGELVAASYRHGSKGKAEIFFLNGMTQAMQRLAEWTHPAFPVTIYYAFKQQENRGGRASGPQAGVTPALAGVSTGWETFLEAVIHAGFSVTGTWPMRTELGNRMIGQDTNALASSIVLVCRKRPADAPTATRREFVTALKKELPDALTHLQRGNIAPVDLAQAAIGPGMAVYTRYDKVLDAEGRALTVRAALTLINQTLDEALAEQESDFDADSRWALAWFEQHGFAKGEYGVAETLSTAKNTSVPGLVEAGILASKAGKVRLLKPEELPVDWNPETDTRLTAWEMVHHLVRVLGAGGEKAAADLAGALGGKAETARELCYRLYTVCERKKQAANALLYNSLVRSWPEITRLAREVKGAALSSGQAVMFDDE